MKESIIKPLYTMEQIKELHYGKDEKKQNNIFTNPASRIVMMVELTCLLLWLGYWYLLIISGFGEDFNFICGKLFLFWLDIFPEGLYTPTGIQRLCAILMGIGLIFVALYILIIIMVKIPNKVYVLITSCVRNSMVHKGLIYVSPFTTDQYYTLSELYKNAKEVLGYLESSCICEICIEENNTVRLCVHDQLVSKEYKYNFGKYTDKIFNPDIIDFTVLDEQVESIINKKVEFLK